MSVVYRLSDTFDLKIGKITVSISPLDYKVKSDMQSYIMAGKPMDAAVLGLKHGVKCVKGLSLPDKSDYELEFEDDESLKENCVNDLLNIPEADKLNIIAFTLVNGIPQGEFLDPQTGENLEGVKFVKKVASRKK